MLQACLRGDHNSYATYLNQEGRSPMHCGVILLLFHEGRKHGLQAQLDGSVCIKMV